MNCASFLYIFAILPAAFALVADRDPLTQTIQLLDELTAKIDKEGKADEKVYQEYSKWCDDTSKNLNFVIERGVEKGNELKAILTKTTADIAALDLKIEDLAASLAVDEKEFNEANTVRTKEASDFAASETELLDGISTLGRAAAIIQREMQKNPSAFAQVDTSSVDKVLKVMNTVIDASSLSFPMTDQKKLTALLQAQHERSESDEDDLGAPAPAAYTYKTSIYETLEDMKEKAENQLSDLQKAEAGAKHNFEMLYSALRAQIKADTQDQNDAKAAKAASQEDKAIAEGDLAEVNEVLGNDKSTLATTSRTCSQVTSDYESNTKARDEELAALATAKKILSETSSGAAEQTYSFLQLAHQSNSGAHTGHKMNSRVDLANAEIVSVLKKLAKESHSSSLAQLAARVAATVRYGANPFSKVKQLITDMVSKLEEEAQADLTEKAYCDDEMGKSGAKKTELNAELSKLTTFMDEATAKSAKLKGEVKDLQASIADIARSQAEMDSMRQESHSDYVTAHADLRLGLEGVRKALGVLREYYGGGAASASMLQEGGEEPAVGGPMAPELKINREAGHLLIHAKEGEAGAKVIEVLEVVESDFSKGLFSAESAEEDAVKEYKKATYSNTYSKGVKENDVKYNTKEYKSLDKSLSDLSSDKDTATSELNAVLEYLGKIRERCIAKPETYATRSARRESETAGLREALRILEGEAVFAQRGKKQGLHAAFLATS